MAFPNDVSDVVVFKIHPAIGIARVSKSDDYFVFGMQPANYKSNGLMKRQAVQFRIFAYGENHVGLGEVTPALMSQLGVSAVWSAEIANRKLAFTARQQGLPTETHIVFGASASSNDANEGHLVASIPGFAEGQNIPLGQITGTGLFIPPKGGVFRKEAGAPVPNFPNHTAEIADTTGDGPVRVKLSGPAQNIPVLSAWIVVAPNDFSPDQLPAPDPGESLLLKLKQLLVQGQGSPGTPHNETARRIDEQSIAPASSDWAPGFETSMGSRSEVPTIQSLFYNPNVEPLLDPREMRVRHKGSPAEPGAVPGQLTSGLCSPWQTDFTACIGYWAENLPTQAFLDEATNTPVRVYRRQYASTGPNPSRLTNGDDFERHQDKIGVVRIVNGKAIETERGPGDDLVDIV